MSSTILDDEDEGDFAVSERGGGGLELTRKEPHSHPHLHPHSQQRQQQRRAASSLYTLPLASNEDFESEDEEYGLGHEDDGPFV